MKTRTILALTLVLSFVLGGVVMARETDGPDVVPQPIRYPPTSDAARICVAEDGLGYDFGFMVPFWNTEAEWWPHLYPTEGVTWEHADQCITVYNRETSQNNSMYNGGYRFDWEVGTEGDCGGWALGAVIAKGGKGDFLYEYPYVEPYTYEDDGLYAPPNPKTDKLYAITHVVFCWNRIGGPGEDECFADETGWAEGTEFDDDSGWAMYVEYQPELTVNLIAGQHDDAGDVTFSASYLDEDGFSVVDITISLDPDAGFLFYYDLEDDEEDNNIKIMGYDDEPDETTSTAPGLFDFKEYADVGLDSYTITVPLYDFYAVHVDLARPVACE